MNAELSEDNGRNCWWQLSVYGFFAAPSNPELNAPGKDYWRWFQRCFPKFSAFELLMQLQFVHGVAASFQFTPNFKKQVSASR